MLLLYPAELAHPGPDETEPYKDITVLEYRAKILQTVPHFFSLGRILQIVQELSFKFCKS